MQPTIAFLSDDAKWQSYREALPKALSAKGISATLHHGPGQPDEVDYIVYAPFGEPVDFSPFTRAKAVLSLWAGVETIVSNPTLTMPLCRMVDPALSAGMVEYVAGHVLRHHLGTDAYVLRQDRTWHGSILPPLAPDRIVGILGLGELGRACGLALRQLGFQVEGWSRRQHEIEGISCHWGRDGFENLLSRAEILVLLLPLTASTENLLGPAEFALMRKGAVLINPGRGALIDDAALIASLDSGHLAHATLDVFRIEPLPHEHPFWSHPRVTVTPHVAAATRVETASSVVADNVLRGEAGEPFLHLVDRGEGY